MAFLRRPFGHKNNEGSHADERGPDEVNGAELSDGSTHYVVEKAANDSEVSYQNAVGAPVEVVSPLGYTVGPVTIIFLNISKMIGTGIFSTPSKILSGTGSIGLSLIFWSLGSLTSLTAFSVYLEFASYFPNRSGSEVVYLEQAFPRPKWLFPTAFAFQSVVLSFSSANSIVFAEYLFSIGTHEPTDWELKGVAIAGYTLTVLIVSLHTRYAYWFSNAVGAVKVLTLLMIVLAGFVVLGGNTSVKHPNENFHNSFEGKATAYGITNTLYKIIFSYAGYENAFNVVNEVKNPVKQIGRNGLVAVLSVTVLYVLTVVAYYSAVPKADIINSDATTAASFFKNVFGSGRAARGLNFLIALSALGNLLAVCIGSSRGIRECGRQGVLPWPRFWASTWPFGTPLGPYLALYVITVAMIIIPPAGDAFNFLTDLKIYPSAFFDFLMGVGVLLVRRRRKHLGLPRPTFKAWDVAVAFNILKNVYLLVMPWYPPDGGPDAGDVGFWYATYAAAGIGCLLACSIYHYAWTWAIPKWRGYRIRQEILELDDGAQSQVLVKVPVDGLEAWDASHDHSGRAVASGRALAPSQGQVLESIRAKDVDST